jgi:hypothetical protein
MQKEVELCAGGTGKDCTVGADLDPEPNRIRQGVDGPPGEGRRGKRPHEVFDDKDGDAETDGVTGICLGTIADFAPEGEVAAACKDLAAELEQVRRAGGFVAKMLVDMETLAEEEVDGVQDGHADVVHTPHLDAFEDGGGVGLNMEFDPAMGHRFVEIADRHGLLIVGGELQTALVAAAQGEPAGLEDPLCLGGAGFGDEKVKVELYAVFEPWNGKRAEGEAFQGCVGDARLQETAMKVSRIREEGRGAGGILRQVPTQAQENLLGQEGDEVLFFEAAEEVEGEAAEVEPIQGALPFTVGEKPKAEAFLGDRVAEDEENGFSDLLLMRKGR